MRDPDLQKGELRTRAFLYLLHRPEGLPQGKLASALRTQTSAMGRVFDPTLFTRAGPKNRPVWSAKPAFFVESVLEHYRTKGILTEDAHAEECRRWLIDHYLKALLAEGPPQAAPRTFPDHLDAIAVLAAVAGVVKEAVGFASGAGRTSPGKARERVEDRFALELFERLPRMLRAIAGSAPGGLGRGLLDLQLDFEKIAENFVGASVDLPEALRVELAESTARGRDVSALMFLHTRGLEAVLRADAE